MQSCTYAYIIFYAHAQVCVVPKTIHTSPTEEIFPYTPLSSPRPPPPPPTHWGIFNPFHGGSMDIFLELHNNCVGVHAPNSSILVPLKRKLDRHWIHIHYFTRQVLL